MKITDTFTIDAKPKRTEQGFLVANVRAVRTGIQQYMGAEIGRPDLGLVNVYRPATEVFNRDSVNSFAGVTLTDNHPDEQVTADNWKDYAVGDVIAGGDAMRDGEFMRLQIMVRDAATIKAIESGKNQLSAGYDAELEWIDGVTDDGLTYQAIQKNIRANHLSIVGAARGGSKLKIGDEKVMTTKNIILDGLMVEVTDAGEAAIIKLRTERDTATATVATRDASITELTKQVETLTGEKAVLEQRVKDAALTPEALNAAVAARAAVVDAAKKIVPTFDAGNKTDAEIKREVVKSRIGDRAVAMTDGAIDGAFEMLLTDGSGNTTVRDSLGTLDNKVVNIGDAQKRMEDAHAAMVAGYARKAD